MQLHLEGVVVVVGIVAEVKYFEKIGIKVALLRSTRVLGNLNLRVKTSQLEWRETELLAIIARDSTVLTSLAITVIMALYGHDEMLQGCLTQKVISSLTVRENVGALVAHVSQLKEKMGREFVMKG